MAFRATRRQFLTTAAMLLPVAAWPGLASAAVDCPRRLSFYHTHTSERLDVVYCEQGRYLPDALAEVNNLLRDFRTGEVHAIDPRLLDLLFALRETTDPDGHYEIISGYRSPVTNATLRDHSTGVAEHSLHMDGKAIDIRVPGFDTARLRRAALALRQGGVGYYPESDFVHVDTGRVRYW